MILWRVDATRERELDGVTDCPRELPTFYVEAVDESAAEMAAMTLVANADRWVRPDVVMLYGLTFERVTS